MWCEPRKQSSARSTTSLEALRLAAIEYLERGWSFIPLQGKLPAISAWKQYQSRRAALPEVKSWFSGNLRQPPSGLGIVTGRLSGLVIVDCDSKEAASFWCDKFPNTSLVVSSGGGGVHFYYSYPEEVAEVRNRARVLGHKIDIRAEGGYVVAPPSSHSSGGAYQWLSFGSQDSVAVFDSTWLHDAAAESRATSSIYVGQVRNAVAYIRKIRAESGKNGHNATFRAACKLRDAGLSKDEALAILSDWNETNATPPWSAKELEHKIKSAFLTGE